MHITDLLPAEKWAELEKELHEQFGVNCAVNDASGARVSGRAFWGNALCPRIQGHKPAAGMICSPLSQYIMRELAENGEPVVEQCDAGMTKFAVPVVVKGELLGAVGCCGCLLENDGEADEIEAFLVSKALGVGDEETAELCRTVPVVEAARGREIVAEITRRVAEIVQNAG